MSLAPLPGFCSSCLGHSYSRDALCFKSVSCLVGGVNRWVVLPAALPNKPRDAAAVTASHGGVFTGATMAHGPIHQLHC